MKQSEKTKAFIDKAIAAHGDKYDYSRTVYTASRERVDVLCADHGVFNIRASNHAAGRGCRECGKEKAAEKLRSTTELFVRDSVKVHGSRYDYSRVAYIKSNAKVKIVCSVHGVFEQTPSNHLTGRGCVKCGHNLAASKSKLTNEEFVRRSNKMHGDRYDYSLADHINSQSKIKIICKLHGMFEQYSYNHLKGIGCSACSNKKRHTNESFTSAAKIKHGCRYDYSLVKYVNNRTRVNIICKEHGEFAQKPNEHLYGCGCPLCPFDREQPTSLYILTDGQGRCKIGISINPNNRISTLNRSNSFTSTFTASWVLPNFGEAYKIEQRIHKKLKHLNSGLTGFDGATEWFAITPSKAVKEVGRVIERAQQMALRF